MQVYRVYPHVTASNRRGKVIYTQQRTFGRTMTIICLVGALLLALTSHSAEAQQISNSAWQKIQALMAEKASRSAAQQKIDSRLLLPMKRRQGDTLFLSVPELRTAVEIDRQGMVLIDIRAEVTDDLLAFIQQLRGSVVNRVPRYDSIRARLPIDQLETLAQRKDIRFIRPAERAMLNKINTSEGDVAHYASDARSTFGVDGSGVRVGALSDSVDALASLQASGDLPAPVTVLPGQSGIPGSSEGTAMLEIVFDLAPGADLFFATAFSGQAQFAQNILDLQAAGCDVIVDDVFYFAEPVFQDGIIAQAVNTFTDAGGLYFSSAGNSGNLNDGTAGVWEGDFVAIAAPPVLGSSTAHNFGGGTNFNTITRDPPAVITLHWADRQGGSGNDYDLFLLNSSNTVVLDSSTNIQNGNDDPFEIIDSFFFDDSGNNLVIIKSAGAGRFLHLNTIRGRLAFATRGQTSGHSAAADAFGVAAVDVATAGGGGFTGGAANPVETFSSDGPRRIFFRPNGTPITPGNFSSTGGTVRQKPDIAAADGVRTATPGFNPFFGTSAAAPHAAAIAALLEDAGNLTPAGLEQVFAHTALDIEAPGFDRDSGWGLLNAEAAVGTTNPGPPNICFVDDLILNGIPNNGPQTFRACFSITAEDGTFDDVTLIADQVILAAGFKSAGPLSVKTTP